MATKEILSLPLTNGDKGVFLARKSAGIYRANMSTSSSATDFKVTADDITELYDGLTIVCKNSVIASAENCTINLNNLGAKRIWLSQSNSYCTTHWAVNQTYIFIYDGTNSRWDLQQGRDTNSNTTYAVFTAPTSSAAGKAGLVPAPASNTMNYVLTASGWKNNASVAYATNANKSTNDSAGQQINTTYIKNATVSGKTVTFTKGDGSTFSFQTQDTTYTIPTDYMSTATVSGKDITFTLKNGSTFKITTQDTNTTYANFGTPTGSVAGTAGLVPAPAKNTMNYILTASGWSNTASAAYATKAGTATRADTATYATDAGTATYAQNIPAQAYVSTATVSGRTITFTRGDGSTFSFQTQDNNTTYGAMTAATTSTDGAAGLVPKPTSSAYNYVLSGHGWVEKANKASTADYATNSGTATHANDAVTTASVSGKDITFTKGNNTTFKITTQDTNTTYAFAEGSTNGKFTVTPSGGSAQSVTVHGLNSLAYKSKVKTTDMEPLFTNTYTNLYGSANDAAGASFYVGKIIPTSYSGVWKIHLRVYIEAAGRTDAKSWHDCWIDGNRNALRTYANYNTIADTTYRAIYYINLYRATEAGITGNYGHLIGLGLRESWSRTTAANARTAKVEIIETIDCTYTPFDTALKYANVPGTGSTNYAGLSELDALNQGLREVGDDNTFVNNRINYFAGKTGAVGVFANGLFMEDSNGTFQGITTSGGTATSKVANSNGFKVGSSIWYTNTSYAANTNITGQNVTYSAISVADTRYSFNVALTAGALTTYKPLYLVGTINDTTRLFYLDATWWTQTPNDTSKVYILVGGVYASSTSAQNYVLYEQNPWYRYDGNKLVEMDKAYLAANGFKMYGDLNMNHRSINNAHFRIINIDGHFMSGLKASLDPEADPPYYDYLVYDEYGTWSLLYGLDEATIPFGGGFPIAHLLYGRPTQSQLNQVLTLTDVKGGIQPSGYTIGKSVPSDAVFTDTKNTAGSTDTSSKIFLIGATSQAANPQTYSDNEVYATNGVLTTKSVQVGGTSATMQYNSTNECIEFVFA